MRFLLLTGAAGGIAEGVANAMVNSGWSILATDQPNAIQSRRSASPPSVVDWIPLDLNDLSQKPSSLRSFEKATRSRLGANKLNAIIHNAAVQHLGTFKELTLTEWRETLDINLLAPILLSNLFLDDLIETKGSIVNISSIHSHLTKPGFTAYATSKAALSGLTRAMAVELGDRVRVNAIEPAAIRTPMLEAGFNDHPELLSLLEKYHPTNSIGSPEDVARAVSFLLDPANSFLNGCVLELGGGIHARLHDPA